MADESVKMSFPEEWVSLNTKPDGSKKPVIMYYVDVSMFYSCGEKLIAKIRDVLDTFAENRENVTVLWRQDRLLKAMLPTGKPGLWDEYSKLVDEFAGNGYGIVDDTSEEDEAYYERIRTDFVTPMPTPGEERAIEFSDAFYGDGGFIANVFRNRGKPVMIENVDILRE